MTDCLLREGQMIGGRPIPLPNSPGVDIVGKIYRIDRHTSRQFDICAGDRVMALTKFGGNARYLAISPEQLIKVPEEIDPAEAACLTETYLTAFQTLHFNQGFMSRYRKTALRGRSIVIIGEMTSSMGRAIAQLSSTAGVDNIYATAKPKHYQRLTALGILPLSLDPLEWYERLRGKIDLIISLEEEITPLHYKLLTSNGEIVKVTQSEVGAYAFGDESSQFSFDTRSRMVCSRVRAQNNSRL